MESESMNLCIYFMQGSYMMPVLCSTFIALNTLTVRKLKNHNHCVQLLAFLLSQMQ